MVWLDAAPLNQPERSLGTNHGGQPRSPFHCLRGWLVGQFGKFRVKDCRRGSANLDHLQQIAKKRQQVSDLAAIGLVGVYGGLIEINPRRPRFSR